MLAIPTTMPAVEIESPGGPQQLRLVSRPVPVPGDDEVLIRVHAAGVNRPDVMQRQGKYAPPPGASDIPGLEAAGEIVALGRRVVGLAAGDRVTALLSGGGYAGFVAAAAPLCLPIPEGFSMLEAAALPENVFTVWSNLFERGACKSGDVVLIHGGTSGIGTIAIQLAATLGARVFATAGGPEKARACERFGAIRGIDYKIEDFVEVVLKQTNGIGADVILDMVSGSYVPRNMKAAAPFARIVSIAALGGTRVEVDIGMLMNKRLTLTGSTLRSRPLAQKAMLAESVHHSVWPLLSAKRVRPVLHATFPAGRRCCGPPAHGELDSYRQNHVECLSGRRAGGAIAVGNSEGSFECRGCPVRH